MGFYPNSRFFLDYFFQLSRSKKHQEILPEHWFVLFGSPHSSKEGHQDRWLSHLDWGSNIGTKNFFHQNFFSKIPPGRQNMGCLKRHFRALNNYTRGERANFRFRPLEAFFSRFRLSKNSKILRASLLIFFATLYRFSAQLHFFFTLKKNFFFFGKIFKKKIFFRKNFPKNFCFSSVYYTQKNLANSKNVFRSSNSP